LTAEIGQMIGFAIDKDDRILVESMGDYGELLGSR